ncbi:TetR/AcrR family transcriptional regulator [Ralstonia solanacearum]|uniref:TetR/AcrR family transcriptional regulator n=1 Tax=Ralstonia solanacearum TaxID=305 RepID=UPI0018D14C76|nr:TetR/AcrR family transcriptional regulator [Ralstonia solanacearum]
MRSSRKQISDTTRAAVPKKRVRLSPEVRRQQILDAALVEFSALGFTAASIAKIARRAGTSKANLYVHFSNKDAIFETLLRDLLVPSRALLQQAQQGQNLDELIDAFIEDAYAGLTPQVIAVIRLLIAESHRVPHLIQRWHEETVVPARAEQQHRIEQYVAAGQMPQTPVTDYFSFVMAPVLYVAICRMVFRQDVAEDEYRNIRETHRKVLHMLLKPAPDGLALPTGRKRAAKPR